jgi:hypothetical protein
VSRETLASSARYAHASSSFAALLPDLPLIGYMWSCIALFAVAALIKCHVRLLFAGTRAVLLPLLLAVTRNFALPLRACSQLEIKGGV